MPRKRQNRNQSIIYTLMRRSHSKPPNHDSSLKLNIDGMKMRQKYSGNKDSKKGRRREFESVENKHYLTNNVSKKIE